MIFHLTNVYCRHLNVVKLVTHRDGEVFFINGFKLLANNEKKIELNKNRFGKFQNNSFKQRTIFYQHRENQKTVEYEYDIRAKLFKSFIK